MQLRLHNFFIPSVYWWEESAYKCRLAELWLSLEITIIFIICSLFKYTSFEWDIDMVMVNMIIAIKSIHVNCPFLYKKENSVSQISPQTLYFAFTQHPLMSRIECKYCLLSSYLTGLFEIFIVLHIWLNCVCLGDFLPMRILCDAYHKDFESYQRSIPGISASTTPFVLAGWYSTWQII